jgi:hypothetical protein
MFGNRLPRRILETGRNEIFQKTAYCHSLYQLFTKRCESDQMKLRWVGHGKPTIQNRNVEVWNFLTMIHYNA